MYIELVYRVHCVRAEENTLTVHVEINVFKCEEIKRTATFYTTYLSPVFVCEKKPYGD
jgi:hypothetical protein